MVHLSDLSWSKTGEEAIKDYKKGDDVKAIVLDVDAEKERISLGIKQVDSDRRWVPAGAGAAAGAAAGPAGVKKGAIVTCTVMQVQENGLEVKFGDGDMTAFIKRSDLSRDRSEQRPERFSVGDKFDAQITQIDRTTPEDHGLHQGDGNQRGEGGGRRLRFLGLGRLARRHSRCRHEEARRRREGPTNTSSMSICGPPLSL